MYLSENNREIDQKLQESVERYVHSSKSGKNTFDHEILFYGVEAVGHAVFLEAAKKARLKGLLDEFLGDFKVEKGDRHEPNHYQIPLSVIAEQGVYIPSSIQKGNFTLFSRDYINRLGMPSSLFQLSNGAEKNLCYRTWEPVDFEDGNILDFGSEFAQDLWVSATGVYEKYRKKTKARQVEPEELSEMCIGLRDYYGQIMNSLENPSLDHEWVVYQMPQLWGIPEPPHQVFIGNTEQLSQYARQSNKEVKTTAHLRAKSRRELMTSLTGLNIF